MHMLLSWTAKALAEDLLLRMSSRASAAPAAGLETLGYVRAGQHQRCYTGTEDGCVCVMQDQMSTFDSIRDRRDDKQMLADTESRTCSLLYT
jgi:hypothetical protein